ncbi:MAG: peptidase signal peptidase [Frondihabitans sp.]|nr:peptidase signal peptidase [Frondihabitans sp.]
MNNTTIGGGRHAALTRVEDPPASSNPSTAHGRYVAREATLAVGGLAGALVVLWLIASLIFGVSMIVFKTGSMSPTIPTGAIAIERPLAATDITKGQVITVPVPGEQLPVTHRVVSVTPDPKVPGGRIVVLKGDANATADITPYHVTKVKLVIFSVPVLGTVFEFTRTPLVLAAITVLLAALVLWSLWPRDPSDDQEKSAEPREVK